MNYPQEPLTARVPEYQNTEIAIPDTYQNKYSVQVETLDVGFFFKSRLSKYSSGYTTRFSKVPIILFFRHSKGTRRI